MSQGWSTGPGWGTGVPADAGRAFSRKRPLGLVLGYTYQQREGSLHHNVPHTGCSGSPGTAGPPRSPAGSSRCSPGTPVLFLGLRARLRAADSTICAGRLRHTGLRASGSSCCRRLLSCCSSPQLLGTERPSVPVLRDKWPQARLHSEGTEMDQPGYVRVRFWIESPTKSRAGAPGSVHRVSVFL